MSYSNLSHAHHTFAFNASHLVKPETFEQACKDPKWIEAMKAKITTLEANKTWSLVLLPLGHRPIECKWVFKIKYNFNGTDEW